MFTPESGDYRYLTRLVLRPDATRMTPLRRMVWYDCVTVYSTYYTQYKQDGNENCLKRYPNYGEGLWIQ